MSKYGKTRTQKKNVFKAEDLMKCFSIFPVFVMFAMLFALGSQCSLPISPGTDTTSSTATSTSTSASVLYIGNSYTYVNDLPGLVENMASTVKVTIDTDEATAGGANFEYHASNSETIAKINSRAWDFVVLQNQSQTPSRKPEDVEAESLPNAQTLVNLIKANNTSTKVIWFQTWGRENGDSGNASYYPLVGTFDGHTQALVDGYNIYQANAGGTVARIGEVWKSVVHDENIPFPVSDLWGVDGSHPDKAGTYLAGLTLIATMFNISPRDISFDAGINATNAAYMREQTATFLNFQ